MGLIRATFDAIGGTLADQWIDFITVPINIKPTSALFPPMLDGTNSNRGSNKFGSEAIVTNGSKIVIPEGYGLLIFQEGELTGFTDQAGRYIWDSENVDSQSIFSGGDWQTSLIKQSWERFKYGGRPTTQQLALFVSLKELPNNRFGTQTPIYWDDAYLNSQVGAVCHGTYSVKIVDPILFAKQFAPASYLQGNDVFDFTDRSNPYSDQLFSEVVATLSATFSAYTNNSERGNRISKIQQDSIGFTKAFNQEIEKAYSWISSRGISISNVTLVGVEYDKDTKELLKTVQRADALSGSRGNSNLQASVASGVESAGKVSGSEGIGVFQGSCHCFLIF